MPGPGVCWDEIAGTVSPQPSQVCWFQGSRVIIFSQRRGQRQFSSSDSNCHQDGSAIISSARSGSVSTRSAGTAMRRAPIPTVQSR